MNKNTALLIIDVQAAMFSYDKMTLYNEREVMNNICSLLKKARASHTKIIFIQHTGDEEYTKGTHTWELDPRLEVSHGETVIEKTTWDAFYKTELDAELKKNNIEKLVIAGMQTEFCLDTSCRRAFSKGYENILVSDAHSTFDSKVLTAKQIVEHHNSVLGGRFAELKVTKEIEF